MNSGENLYWWISPMSESFVEGQRAINLNQPINGVRPYAGFSTITDFEQAGSSITTRCRYAWSVDSRGIGFMSSYTWGHAIDDRPGQGSARVEDNYNLKAERGDADFDVRHH